MLLFVIFWVLGSITLLIGIFIGKHLTQHQVNTDVKPISSSNKFVGVVSAPTIAQLKKRETLIEETDKAMTETLTNLTRKNTTVNR